MNRQPRTTGGTGERHGLVIGLLTLTLVLLAAADLLTRWQYSAGLPEPYDFWFEGSVGTLAYGVLGALIVMKAPDNRMGRLMVGLAFVSSIQAMSGSLAASAQQLAISTSVESTLHDVSDACQMLVVGGAILLLLLAPTGRQLTPRWNFIIGVTIVGTVASAADALLFSGERAGQIQPEGLVGALHGLLAGLGLGLLCALAMAPICLGLRWHRASGQERQQVVWVAAGGLAGPGVILLWSAVLNVGGVDPLSPVDAWVNGSVIWALASTALPAGIAVAVLRHKLYDIDRFVSRTLSYTLVTGVLFVIYGVVVTALGQLLPESNGLAVAAATLTAAAVFRPLLSRVQFVVDRRFNRSRYDGEQAVAEFANTLRNELDPDQVTAEVLAVLSRTLQPAQVTVWTAAGTRD